MIENSSTMWSHLPHWFINFWQDDVCCGGLLGDTKVRISCTYINALHTLYRASDSLSTYWSNRNYYDWLIDWWQFSRCTLVGQETLSSETIAIYGELMPRVLTTRRTISLVVLPQKIDFKHVEEKTIASVVSTLSMKLWTNTVKFYHRAINCIWIIRQVMITRNNDRSDESFEIHGCPKSMQYWNYE